MKQPVRPRTIGTLAPLVCAAGAAMGQSATLEIIDGLMGPNSQFYPYAVTPNGSVLVGMSSVGVESEAARWQRGAGIASLGDIPGGDRKGRATAVSDDGVVVAGYGWNGENSRAFRWTAASGMVELPLLPDFPPDVTDSMANAMTPDASLIVGLCGIIGFGTPLYEARWSDGGVEGEMSYQGQGVSSDGTIIAGQGATNTRAQAWVWTVGEPEVQWLGKVPGAYDDYSSSSAISRDGETIVGVYNARRGADPISGGFLWREESGMQDLGHLDGIDNWGVTSSGVSADGSVVVGYQYCGGCPEIGHAFIWDAAHGMRHLGEVLETEYGLNLGGVRLRWATAISPDGRWIAGVADVGLGGQNLPAFLVHLAVCEPDLDGDGVLTLFDFLTFMNLFNAADPAADWDSSGVFDLFDFLGYVNAFNQGC